MKYRYLEEYYKKEPGLVGNFLLKGEQELFRQSGFFLETGAAYMEPGGGGQGWGRGAQNAGGTRGCELGRGSWPGERGPN